MIVDLFKYYSPEYEGKPNISFIEKNSLYFQIPSKFNDPWDCKLHKIELPRQKKQIKEIYFKMLKNLDKSKLENYWQQKYENYTRSKLKEMLNNLFIDSIENFRNRIGVLCLTFIPDSELLWSHYANGHQGYLLHFKIDLTDNSNLYKTGAPIIVKYKNKRFKWNLDDYINDKSKQNEYILNLTRHKSNVWQYEYELRLVNNKISGFIEIPKGWLKSIVLGCEIDDELKTKLVDYGKSSNIPVYSAELDSNEYKINIPDFDINGEKGISNYEAVLKCNDKYDKKLDAVN